MCTTNNSGMVVHTKLLILWGISDVIGLVYHVYHLIFIFIHSMININGRWSMVKERNLLVHAVHMVHIRRNPFKSRVCVCTTNLTVVVVYRYTGVSWTEAFFIEKGSMYVCTVHIANAMIVVNAHHHCLSGTPPSSPERKRRAWSEAPGV